MKAVEAALTGAGLAVEPAELTRVPKTTAAVEGSEARRVLNLIDDLEELDDVQEVYANFDISDEVLASIAG
jgi:transcriptional/translational regulatory protein YebC/TACO1